jgi:hypothetical protein
VRYENKIEGEMEIRKTHLVSRYQVLDVLYVINPHITGHGCYHYLPVLQVRELRFK